MQTFLDRVATLDIKNVAMLLCLASVVLLAIFFLLWKHANKARAQLRRDLAEQKALFADSRDKLILEQGYANELIVTLEKANATIAGKNIELNIARQKIASLNGENDATYTNYVNAAEELKQNGGALRYWQYFARKVLRISRSHLDYIDATLKDKLRSQNGPGLALVLESIECVLELNELTEVNDIPQRIREMRADAARPPIHLIPRLQRFIEDCEKILGSRFTSKTPLFQQPVLFTGSWAHLELALTAMLSNARKHSIDSTPIELELLCSDLRATFQVTNRSSTPVADSIIKAKNEFMVSDYQQTRFDLYLIDQIAAGYRAIVKLENLSVPEDQGHVVRIGFSFSLR